MAEVDKENGMSSHCLVCFIYSACIKLVKELFSSSKLKRCFFSVKTYE